MRFKRAIKICATCLVAGFIECDWLGVHARAWFGSSFANNLTIMDYNRTYCWAWSYTAHRLFS
jgi:hypothetical protein